MDRALQGYQPCSGNAQSPNCSITTRIPISRLNTFRMSSTLRFNHSRKVEGSKPSHPTNLNPDVISYEAFLKRSLPNNSVSGVESKSLWKLDPSDFNENRLRDWLKRLQRPDIPGLPELIAKDLSHRNSSGFGSINIHRKLLLSQLDKLLELKPKLLDRYQFHQYLPSAACTK